MLAHHVPGLQCGCKGLLGFQDAALQQAATLLLVKALDCTQPDEADFASDLMMDFTFMTSEVQKAFLAVICNARDMWVVLSWVRNYSLEVDQQMYSTVLQRLASTPGALDCCDWVQRCVTVMLWRL